MLPHRGRYFEHAHENAYLRKASKPPALPERAKEISLGLDFLRHQQCNLHLAVNSDRGQLVSFAFTIVQACWRDGDDKATKMNRTFAEIMDRREKIVFAVRQSTTLLDFVSRVHAIPTTRAEFKNVSLPALTADLKDYQIITYALPGAAEFGDAIVKAAGVTENDLVFFEILNGEPVEELTDDDFKNMKEA